MCNEQEWGPLEYIFWEPHRIKQFTVQDNAASNSQRRPWQKYGKQNTGKYNDDAQCPRRECAHCGTPRGSLKKCVSSVGASCGALQTHRMPRECTGEHNTAEPTPLTTAAEQPDSSHALTTEVMVAAGQPAVLMHLSYVPRQVHTASGDVRLSSVHVVSAAPHSCSVGPSQVSGAFTAPVGVHCAHACNGDKCGETTSNTATAVCRASTQTRNLRIAIVSMQRENKSTSTRVRSSPQTHCSPPPRTPQSRPAPWNLGSQPPRCSCQTGLCTRTRTADRGR